MTDEDLIHADASQDLSQSGQQSSVPTGKTMAEIARSAWMSAGDLEDHWAIAADAVIDECAKAVAALARKQGGSAWAEGVNDARIMHADFLRSLKSNPKGEDHDAG